MGFACIEGGMAFSAGPIDVCMTPPVAEPIPYENIGEYPIAEPPSETVVLQGMPACNMGSIIATSEGDEPGCFLGVASGLFMGPIESVLGFFPVIFDELPALAQGMTLTIQNGTNCVGDYLEPSQFSVEPG